MEKEEAKYREKYKEKGLMVGPPEVCRNFREEVLRQIWEEHSNQPLETRLKETMLDKLKEGMNKTLTPDEFVLSLKEKTAAKKIQLLESEFWQIVSAQETVDVKTDLEVAANSEQP